MRRFHAKLQVLLAFVLLYSAALPLPAKAVTYLTGDDLAAYCRSEGPEVLFCYGYLSGYTEAVQLLTDRLPCVPPEATAEEKRLHFLRSPVTAIGADKTASAVVFWALAEQYGCKG